MIRIKLINNIEKKILTKKSLHGAALSQPFGPASLVPGRCANSGITATVFGGYGFVGRYFLSELGAVGSRAYVPFRGCELEVRHIKPMFDVGQVGFVPFSPRDHASIIESIQHSDIVINLIGKYYETKHVVPTRREDGKLSRINYSYEDVNILIPETLAKLSKECGIKSFIHMSALSANPESNSKWSRSKYLGEEAVKKHFPEAIIVRPSTIFGHEDRFLNYIAESMEKLPFSPLLNNGKTLVQPVYANDLGRALMLMVYNWREFQGKTFQLVGPAEYSYKEIFEYVSDVTNLKKPFIDVPLPIANAVAYGLGFTIAPFFSQDNIIQMTEDCIANTTDESLLSFKDLNITPQSLDKVAFDFLHRFRPGGHFVKVKGYH